MKKFTTLLMTLMLMSTALWAEETITVSANSSDISEGLDLKVVAKLFAEAKNLEEFETMLNNPDSAFCNLDLNGDGQVDYLRVVETGEGNKRLIVLQAILAKDIYQDVASIYVEKDESDNVSVQVVGDEYVYGSNYIIEPVYITRPYIYDWYWGYYPRWWHVHHCWAHDWYWHRCYAYHHHHHWCSFRPGHALRHGYHDLYHHVRRHDYAMAHPHRSFEHRNNGMRNAREIRSQHAADYRRSFAAGHAPQQRQGAGNASAPSFSREARTYGSRTTAYNRQSNVQRGQMEGRRPDAHMQQAQHRSSDMQAQRSNSYQTQRPNNAQTQQRSSVNTQTQRPNSYQTQRPSNTQTQQRSSVNTQTQTYRPSGNTRTVRRPSQSSSNTQRSSYSGSYNSGQRSSSSSSSSSSSYSGSHRSSSSSSSYSGGGRSSYSSGSYGGGRSSSSSSSSSGRSSGSYSGGSHSSGSYSGGGHSSSGGGRSSGGSHGGGGGGHRR